MTALEMQWAYLEMVKQYVATGDMNMTREHDIALELWERTLTAVETNNHSLIASDIDWAIKKQLVDSYRAKNDLELDSPRIAQLDLMYHDITQTRGLFYLLQNNGRVNRVTTDSEILDAQTVPPQTTRAKLRGDFIAAAQEAGKDISVDWVHLKMNDQSQRTVLCKDPFANVDERVQKLIESMQESAST
jgi:proteasome accessory factor A